VIRAECTINLLVQAFHTRVKFTQADRVPWLAGTEEDGQEKMGNAAATCGTSCTYGEVVVQLFDLRDSHSMVSSGGTFRKVPTRWGSIFHAKASQLRPSWWDSMLMSAVESGASLLRRLVVWKGGQRDEEWKYGATLLCLVLPIRFPIAPDLAW